MPHSAPADEEPAFGAFAPKGLVARVISRTRGASDGWLARREVFALRRLAIARLGGAPVDVEAFGARMRLHPYRNVCEKRILFTPQFFDPVERAALLSRLRPGFVFLDIGANIGGYALAVAAAAGADCQIVAVEPQPDIARRLAYNVAANGFATVRVRQCAVADRDGELTLFIDGDNQGESSVKIIHDDPAGGRLTVPSRTLLTLIREEGLGVVDAVKLDTEGAEDIILETFFAEAPAELWPRLVVMERGGARWHMDLPRLMATSGYRVIAQTRNNVLYER